MLLYLRRSWSTFREHIEPDLVLLVLYFVVVPIVAYVVSLRLLDVYY